MNTEIIRGNALQILELVEEVTRLTNEVGYAQYDKEQKDQRITALEKEKEELNTRCERLNADAIAYCNYGKEIEKKKNNEIKAIKEEMGRLTANLADTQSALLQHRIMIEEAKRFVDSEKEKYAELVERIDRERDYHIKEEVDLDDEIARLRGLLARNRIKYKKVK